MTAVESITTTVSVTGARLRSEFFTSVYPGQALSAVMRTMERTAACRISRHLWDGAKALSVLMIFLDTAKYPIKLLADR